ncbi:MAG: hypothetical protein WA990_01025 [Rubrobacteraceae bacterium]
MRKLMLLAAMLAMVLVAAAPALAQDATAGDDGTATGGDVTTTDTQYQNQTAAIVQDCRTYVNNAQYGDAGGDIVTGINVTGAQCQAIINQVQAGEDANSAVNAVLGTDGTGGEVVDDSGVVVYENGVDDDADGVVDEADGSEEAAVVAEADAGADAGAVTTLPDTGGASLFTLGAGALLVGGGLLARRIFS